MSATHVDASFPKLRVPPAVRAAQALLLLPLGALQLVAASVFTVTADNPSVGDYAVAAWAIVMSAAGIAIGLRLPRARRAAFVLLAAQGAFGLVKLLAYHESASFVFFALTAATAVLLLLPSSRASR